MADVLIRFAGLVIAYFITQIFDDFFLIKYDKKKIKFRFHEGQLNPFISHDRAIVIRIAEIMVAIVFSFYIENFLISVLVENAQYRYPILSGTSFMTYVLVVRELTEPTLNRVLVAVILLIVFLLSLKVYTNIL